MVTSQSDETLAKHRLLRRRTQEARQILRRLLVGRLVFRPQIGEGRPYYEFSGEGSLSRILAGIVATEGLVAPTGFEPVFPHRRTLLPANQGLAAC
jgi:hypothetical protein